MRFLGSPGFLLALLLSAGGLFTLANRKLPLVRNSLVYARASENVIAHGYDPRPVVADSKLSYDKPILYAWSSAPFVAALGNHDGLRATSFLTTSLYLLDVNYYGDAQRGFRPEGDDFYVYAQRPVELAELGTVTDLGAGVRHVVRGG